MFCFSKLRQLLSFSSHEFAGFRVSLVFNYHLHFLTMLPFSRDMGFGLGVMGFLSGRQAMGEVCYSYGFI